MNDSAGFNRWILIAGLAAAGFVGAVVVQVAKLVAAHGASAGDWLQFSGGALGSIFAVAGAYGLETWRRRAEERSAKSEALQEVLNGYISAREVYDLAKAQFPTVHRKSLEAAALAVNARLMSNTLDRLLSKPHLTDGAIAIGAGGILLMKSVLDGAAILDEDDGIQHQLRASEKLKSCAALLVITEQRFGDVVRYGKKREFLPFMTPEVSVRPTKPSTAHQSDTAA